MIEIEINKEIGAYEPKIIGPLTARQLLCIVIAAPLSIFLYNFFAPLITSDLAGFLCFIPAVIAYFIGWQKPYGMHTEKFIQSIFITTVMAPTNRPYKTVNRHEELIKKLASGESEPPAGDLVYEKESGTTSKKSRYKVSPLAIN